MPSTAIAIIALRPNDISRSVAACAWRPGQSRAANLAAELNVESSVEPALVSMTALKINSIHTPIVAGTATATEGTGSIPAAIA